MRRMRRRRPLISNVVGAAIINCLLSFSSSVSCLSFTTPSNALKEYYTAEIDYSAANEYVEAHYGKLAPRTPYFGCSKKTEPIYNAREGLYDDERECMRHATIDSCGFTLLDKPSKISDWNDLSQIRTIFLPELRELLKEAYGGGDTRIRRIVCWNPVVRRQDLKQTRPNDGATTPTASFAATPHIDIDIGAYESPDDLVTLFEKNRVDLDESFPRQDIINDIKEGRRFAIANAWRNIAKTPVSRSPLALFSVRYDGQKAFPDAAPSNNLSRWYIFPDMDKDEVLLFVQYDRDVTRPSDLWHCGLVNTGDPSVSSRSSFDIRCFIVFDEIVPEENDRFSASRIGSVLTLEESGCFCDEQAERRGISQAS